MPKSVLVCIVAVLLSGSPAGAQDVGGARDALGAGSTSRFGAPGTVSIAAERLFGVTHAIPSGGSSITTISLLGPGGLEAGVAPYSIPRLALDAFLADGLTLGIGAEFAVMSQSSSGSSNVTVLGVNPRVGFVARLDDRVVFWPRAGLSYVRVSSGGDAYLLAASIEPQLVVTALPHVAFSVSPTLDVGLAATGGKVSQIGLQVGVLGWF